MIDIVEHVRGQHMKPVNKYELGGAKMTNLRGIGVCYAQGKRANMEDEYQVYMFVCLLFMFMFVYVVFKIEMNLVVRK